MPGAVNESERQIGKVCILAFGFGGGVAALVNMAIAYQMDLEPLAGVVLPTATPEQLDKANTAWERAFLKGEDFELSRDAYMACDVLKQKFRTTNPAITKMRYDLNAAILSAVEAKDGTVYNVGRCQVWCNQSFLVIQLPSGRRLLYASPQLKMEEIEDPLGGKSWKSRYVSYLTVRGKSWKRERAWSGLFVENIVQAIANDVLRAAMLRVHDDTLDGASDRVVPATSGRCTRGPRSAFTCTTKSGSTCRRAATPRSGSWRCSSRKRAGWMGCRSRPIRGHTNDTERGDLWRRRSTRRSRGGDVDGAPEDAAGRDHMAPIQGTTVAVLPVYGRDMTERRDLEPRRSWIATKRSRGSRRARSSGARSTAR